MQLNPKTRFISVLTGFIQDWPLLIPFFVLTTTAQATTPTTGGSSHELLNEPTKETLTPAYSHWHWVTSGHLGRIRRTAGVEIAPPNFKVSRTVETTSRFHCQCILIPKLETGTRIQTLLEVDFPSMSVFSSNNLTLTTPSAQTLDPALDIAQRVVNTRPDKQLVQDGSAADPASIGVGVLLGNGTRAPSAN